MHDELIDLRPRVMQATSWRVSRKDKFKLLHNVGSGFQFRDRVVHAFVQVQSGDGLVKTWTREAVGFWIAKDA